MEGQISESKLINKKPSQYDNAENLSLWTKIVHYKLENQMHAY